MIRAIKSLRRRALRLVEHHVGERIRLAALLRAVTPHLQNGVKDVLDAGSGNGKAAFLLARRHPGLQIHGVDVRDEPLEASARRASAEGLANITFARADLTDSLGEDRYDLIYNIDVLEHIADDRGAIASFARALRSGGRVVIHTPLTPQRHFLRRFDLAERVNALHVREGYRRGELEGKLADAGLTVERVAYTHGRAGTLAWELWRLTQQSLLAGLLIRPLVELLIALERLRADRPAGNCILVAARKP